MTKAGLALCFLALLMFSERLKAAGEPGGVVNSPPATPASPAASNAAAAAAPATPSFPATHNVPQVPKTPPVSAQPSSPETRSDAASQRLEESGESTVSQPTSDGNPAESLLKMRDPFKRPEAVAEEGGQKSDLELYASHQFQLVGVMTGPRDIRAILLSPGGKTFFIKKGERIGQRRGIIEKITPEKILIQEKIVNVLGQAENVTTEIKINLPSATKGLSLAPTQPRTGNPPDKR